MIPIIDDYIQTMLVNKLRFLKENVAIMDSIFRTGNPDTIGKLKEFITTKKIRVVIGFPREQSTLPAYVITLAPEQEQPSGLGENWTTYGREGIGDLDEEPAEVAQDYLDDTISSTFMNSNYRIECWRDNGDLTAYMYAILKWALWSSRKEMLQIGWNNIRLEGTDLEPVPDYMPIFIYRRAAQLILTYDNLYHEDVNDSIQLLDIIAHPENYSKDSKNNIINKDGKVVLSASHTVILSPHFYEGNLISFDPKKTTIPVYTKTYKTFPVAGKEGVLYLEQSTSNSGEYTAYIWDSNEQNYIPTVLNYSGYEQIVVINHNKGR